MTNSILLLRADEQKRFAALPEELKDGWKVEEEKLNTEERPEELKMRSLMIGDGEAGVLLNALQNLSAAKKPDECRTALEKLTKMSHADALEVFFAAGIQTLSLFLRAVLEKAETDEDLHAVAEFSAIRHALLESNELSPARL